MAADVPSIESQAGDAQTRGKPHPVLHPPRLRKPVSRVVGYLLGLLLAAYLGAPIARAQTEDGARPTAEGWQRVAQRGPSTPPAAAAALQGPAVAETTEPVKDGPQEADEPPASSGAAQELDRSPTEADMLSSQEPRVEEPAAAYSAEEEPSAMEVCAQPPEHEMGMLERMRRRLTVSACASSAWLDSLFGDQIHYSDYRETYGSVSTGGLWSEYDGFDPRLRFRVRLQLPQWDERISAFAGRVGQQDYISDTENEFDALPTRQFGDLEDESVLVGLGYSNPRRTGNDFDAGVGVRVDLPLDPYARARYELVRAFSEHYVLTARETIFWQNSEGFGTTTRVNLDRALSDRMLLRWSNVGKYTEETLGLEWYTQLTLFQSIGQRTGLAWQLQVEGATDNEVQLTRYSARLIMRRQLTADWLFLELRGGAGWPRRKLSEEREISPEIGVALEMQFGSRE